MELGWIVAEERERIWRIGFMPNGGRLNSCVSKIAEERLRFVEKI